MEAEKKRIRLDEVTLMRCILALLIVFMHAFTCYQGGWAQPEGYIDIPVYKWIARTSFAFTLEAFVFISGYLYAFQRITLKRVEGMIRLIINKLKRLILPSIIFSILYFIIFYSYKGLGNAVYSILNGCGHMWFLPMLFWCFVGGWLLEQIKISDGWKLVFLILLNIFWPFSMPLRLSEATNYLVYFYGGFLVYKYIELIKPAVKPSLIALSWAVFLLLFVIFRPLKETITIGDQSDRVLRMLSSFARSGCQFIYASAGTIAFYFTVLRQTQKQQLRTFTIKLASCCFGIYLFQQFLLKGLYYKTDFAALVGPYWLPWLGFLIAAPLSFLITDLLLKTRSGKYLIG